MAFSFDIFVRPPDADPPIKAPFPGFLLLLNTAVISYVYIYLFPAGVAGFFHFITWINNTILVLDGLVSNNFGRNIVNLRHYGWSDSHIYFYMLTNMICSQLLGFLVFHYLLPEYVFTWTHHANILSSPVSMVRILMGTTLTLLLSEICFWFGHKQLHEDHRMMKLHVFHHCCTFSSWNTNLMFHPFDLLIEFTAPALAVVGIHVIVLQDPTCLFFTYIVFQLLYAFEHDESFQSFSWHGRHHSLCDSVYVIYTGGKSDPRRNQLGTYIRSLNIDKPKRL